MKTCGIIGGTGYTAGELIRIILNHPHLDLKFVYSHSAPGESVAKHHEDLFHVDMLMSGEIEECDVLFLCLGHGLSKAFLENHAIGNETLIVDLSNDYRMDPNWDYGLPELGDKYGLKIANPGCFATAIQLALIPLLKAKLITSDIHVTGVTGSTGAGKKMNETSHFSWRNNNISIYKLFSHQHLQEIYQTANKLVSDFDQAIQFVPMRGSFSRGILVSMYTDFNGNQEEALKLYQDEYQNAPFVHVGDEEIHLKQVVNTNYNCLSVQVIEGKIHVTSIIDNLLKGASGQAVQNVNQFFGWNQKAGLNLKANIF